MVVSGDDKVVPSEEGGDGIKESAIDLQLKISENEIQATPTATHPRLFFTSKG